jgi:hypothetical protein
MANIVSSYCINNILVVAFADAYTSYLHNWKDAMAEPLAVVFLLHHYCHISLLLNKQTKRKTFG